MGMYEQIYPRQNAASLAVDEGADVASVLFGGADI